MPNKQLLDEFAQRASRMLAASPAADIEKNFRALVAGWLARLDLVTREDFDIQRELLAKAQAQLRALEARITELEQRRG
ncbi:MAG: accessory factor UbiK family protein [Proteobacteria bacterium]|nr:accessory factor UbiK family protein [Pseudomonadota bacterium]